MGRKIEDYRGWPVSLPGEVEKLLDKSNYYKGRMSTCPRYNNIEYRYCLIIYEYKIHCY